ncbi:MAG: GNAT family N-acetyltransferase [Candidatus Methanofastidiosia archaeon]|jgi:GNAT superfamily N-acetyltransferase
MDAFKKALTTVYCKYPCQVLPNALWKTLAIADEYKSEIKLNQKKIVHIKLWNKNKLQVYWTYDRNINLSHEYINSVLFMLIHNDYIHRIPLKEFTYQRYFRLVCDTVPPFIDIPYDIVPVDTGSDKELRMVSTVIDKCYPNFSPSFETVKTWTTHPVFDKSLWVWALDGSTPAGLGIGEVDSNIKEASLEWIQVLPEYRGKKIGKALVQKLLQRVHKKVKFTTVSGRYGETNKFYKGCGFTGDDIWWVLSR